MSLAEPPVAPKPQVDARIRAALGGLRSRIRMYVLSEGLAAVVIWLGATFWASFALDYFPVLLGASEMPQVARGVLLAIVAIGAGYVVHRWLLTRLSVPLSDRSLALLMERRHRDFHDSLVTTVELNDGRDDDGDPLTQEMLVNAGRQAVDQLPTARLSDVFNFQPLLRNIGLAVLLIVTIVAAYATNAGAMTKAANRLYGLNNELWERFAKIEVVGIEVRRPSQDANSVGPQSLTFTDGLIKVARGSNVTLRVEADEKAPVLPEQCYLNYRTEEGDRGSVTIKRVGKPKEGKQLYVCDAKPLAGILSSLEFDVLGYDHRLSGYRIEVVDSPAIVDAKMKLQYPSYMARVQWPSKAVLSSGNAVEQGTHITLHFTSSKPLLQAEVRLLDPQATDVEKIEVERKSLSFTSGQETTQFTFEIPSLAANRTIEVSLTDTDGVASERPYRVFLTVIPDEAPRWELTLQGIGSQITPDAIVPLAGKVTDDHGVAAVWLDATIGELEPVRFDVQRPKESEFTYAMEITHALDFREERTDREEFRLTPGQRVSILGRATDRYDLAEQPNEGVSERYVLEVVTPDQLLVSLEARELALRRRFEVIIEEMTAMRDSLLRIKPGEKPSAENLDPAEAAEPGEKKLSPEEQERRESELRVLRVQRALQQSRKSSQEISGVAQAFDAIREELTNNRVDTEDRKSRLKEQIADPLHAVVADDFVKLDELLLALEPLANDTEQGPPAVEASLTRSNELLAKLDQVLQKMLRLESFNEVVDILRDLIKEEHALADDTKKLQRRDLLDDEE